MICMCVKSMIKSSTHKFLTSENGSSWVAGGAYLGSGNMSYTGLLLSNLKTWVEKIINSTT